MASAASAHFVAFLPLNISTSPHLSEKVCLDAVAALRATTHPLHEQLDRNLPLGQANAALADYAARLTVLRDWHHALAPWLSRALIDLAALALLEQDLQDFPAQTHELTAVPAPDLTALRQADDGLDGFCWGIAYVVEVSRLGGQVLYRRLCRQLAPHPLRYFSQRSCTGVPWPELLACLRSHLAAGSERRSACNGAAAAFELLLARFRHAGCIA